MNTCTCPFSHPFLTPPVSHPFSHTPFSHPFLTHPLSHPFLTPLSNNHFITSLSHTLSHSPFITSLYHNPFITYLFTLIQIWFLEYLKLRCFYVGLLYLQNILMYCMLVRAVMHLSKVHDATKQTVCKYMYFNC